MRQKNLLQRIATFALTGALLMPSVFGASGMIVHAEEAPDYDAASAVNYSNILDDMVDFGVFANTFTQNEHMESTLAVGTYTNKSSNPDGNNNDVDFLTQDSTAHIVVGNITDYSKMRFGKTTAGTFKFELSQSLYDEFSEHTYSPKSNRTEHFIFDTSFFDNNPTVQVSQKDVTTWVSDKIKDIKTTSETLKGKNVINYNSYIKSGYLDLSDSSFEGKTVYINIDSNLKSMLSEASGLKIKKNSSTVIVFNYNGNDSITFNKFEVAVKQKNGSFVTITSETKWQGEEGTGNQTVTNVDKEICQKIIWNITDNPKVKLNTTAGVFLAPNCKQVEIYQGSCAGWLVADTITSNKEWHYIYRGGSQEITTDKVGEIHFALDKAFTKEWNGNNTVADTTISSNAGDYSFSLKRMKDNTYSEEADNKDHNKNASNAATGKVTFPSIAFHSGTEYATSPYYVEKGKTKHYYYKITEDGAGTRSGDILKSSGYVTIDLAVTNTDGTLYFKADYTIRLGDNSKTIYKSVTNADPSSSEFRLGKFFNKVGPEPGALEVYVYEKGTTTPVEGATVSVGSESLGKTDATGKKEKSDLEAGDYTVSVVAPDNYKVSGDASKTQEVTSGNTTTYIFYVEKVPGALEVYVYEKGTTTPVEGATVTVGSESLGKTDSTGKKEKNNLEAGDYTVSIEAPENYKVYGDATKTQAVTSGNTTTYTFYVEKIPGALEVYVYEKGTTTPVEGATVTVGSESLGKTDATGKKEKSDLEAGEYTVSVVAPENYKVYGDATKTQAVTSGNTTTYTFYVEKIPGALEVYVYEKGTTTPVEGATVTVGSESLGKTDSTGKKEKSDLDAGNYTVSIEAPENYKVYGDATKTQAVTSGNTTTYTFYVEKIPGALEVYVYEKGTTKPVEGATVSVGSESLGKTDSTGKKEKSDLDAGNYTVSIEAPENYKVYGDATKTQAVTSGNTTTYIFYVEKETVTPVKGALEVYVYEKGTTTPVEGATVSVGSESLGKTDATGKKEKSNLAAGDYTVTIEAPENYKVYGDATKTQAVTSGNTTTYIFYVEKETVTPVKGALEVYVYEKGTTTPVEGATVNVGSESLGKTDATGKKEKGDLEAGEYTVSVVAPDNYKVSGESSKTDTVTNGNTTTYIFYVEKETVTPVKGALEVYVYEKGTTTPVEGATVSVGSESLGKTDATGKKEKSDLEAGEYTVSVVAPDNYKVSGESSKTDTVTNGNTTTYIFYVEKETVTPVKGALEVYVYEKGTTTPVEGATVTVGSESLGKTDATGKKEKSNLAAGDYTVTIEAPENYKVYGDATKTQAVTSGNTTTYIFYVEEKIVPPVKGSIEVIVYKAGTTTPVEGVSVTVGSEKLGTTNSEGKIGKTDLSEGDYTVSIEAPANYEVSGDAIQTQPVTSGNTTTYTFYVEEKIVPPVKGSIEVIVYKAGTTTPVEGVSVTVGSEKLGTTNSEGKIAKGDLEAGEYTVSVVAPDNYKVSGESSKTDTVTNGNTTTYIFYVEKETVTPVKGALEVYVYEKGTTTPVEGATVSVGSESLGKTDATGKKEKSDLEAGDYTVSVVAPDNYKVSGESSKTDTVTNGNTTTYIFYVEKETVTPEKGAIEVIVYKKGTTDLVEGAKVFLDGVELGTTGEAGRVEKSNLEAKDYKVSIEAPANYKVSGDASKTQAVTSGNTTKYIFYVEETGSLTIKVEDEVTGNPVQGAKVSVKQPDGSTKYYTTDKNGEVKEYSKTASGEHKTPIGSYEINVTEAPDGYNVTTGKAKTVSVTQGSETTHIAKVDLVKGGALTIKVVDEVYGTPVSGAKVEVTQPDGTKKTYQTNSDGEITEYAKTVKDKKGKDVYLAPVGEYSVKIVSVPDGSTVTVGKESTVKVSLGQKSEHIAKVNTALGGALLIKVEDEETGEAVKGASLEVTEPDGTKKTYVTDADGEVKDYMKTVKDANGHDVYVSPTGTYSIKVTDVPKGYKVTVGEEKTVSVSLGKKSEHLVKINTSGASNTNTGNTNTSNTNTGNTNTSNTNTPNTSTPSKNSSTGTGTVESTNLTNNKDTSTTTITSIDTKGTGGNNSTVKSQKTGESKLPYILFASIMLMIIVGAILYVKIHKEDDLEDISL